jgi:transposase
MPDNTFVANRSAPPLAVSEDERRRLETWTRSRVIPQRDVQRAKVILLAAEGVPNHEIAARTGCSQPTVRLWRSRFSERGLAGLQEREGRGHPFTYTEDDVARIIATTLKGPPAGSTHWSTRTMAAHLGMSASTVERIWREHRLQPHLVSTFKYSNDPQLEAKVTDIVGLYLNPPERAIVLCVDEKTMIQALDRTQPLLPMKPGQVARHTHDYVRNGTTDLYAALDVATGNVTHQFTERHRAIEFLDFLKLVARTYPRKELHLVVDNSSTHETKEVFAWLQKHPRIHLHFTPTSSSWMNQVETWFSLLNSRAIRRGAFKNVHSLRDAIQRFLDAWNDAAHPFKWVKTADDIMAKAKRKDSSDSGH